MIGLEVAVAMVLDRFLAFHRDPALWGWHRRWLEWLERRGLPGSGWPALGLLLGPPVALLLWLDLVLPGWLGALLGVLVLLHAFGPRDLYRISEQCRRARRRQDAAAMQACADELGTDPAADDVALARALTRAVLHQYLSPVFWMLLIGPAGALLVRGAAGWLGERDLPATALRGAARDLLAVLDWVPVRLALVLFGIVGNFDAAWRAWQPQRQALPMYNANLRHLESVALAAAGASSPESVLPSTRGVLMRALALVFVIALLLGFWY